MREEQHRHRVKVRSYVITTLGQGQYRVVLQKPSFTMVIVQTGSPKWLCSHFTKMGHQDRLSPVLMAPMRSTVPNLVYAANGSEVRTATVAGKVLVRDREVFTADEDAIRAEAQVQAERAA